MSIHHQPTPLSHVHLVLIGRLDEQKQTQFKTQHCSKNIGRRTMLLKKCEENGSMGKN